MKFSFLYGVFLFCAGLATAQNYVQLQNPSFEDAPGQGQTPMGWQNCGVGQESPPDIHASSNQSFFGVNHPSYEGKTYLGMIVRENDTWEAVGQKLSVPLQGSECYVFNVYLARSGDYKSPTTFSKDPVDYKKPAIVTLWGGYDYCDRAELLAQSPPIENFDWQDYQFFFQPTKTYTHFIIEAYFDGNEGVAYNGNVLVDFASPITLANCETGEENLQVIDSEIVIEPKVKPKEKRLQKVADLEALIVRNLAALKYESDEENLPKSVADILVEIGQAKLDFSRYRLEISVKENPANLTESRIQKIKDLFMEKEIPTTSFRVFEARVADKEKTWVGENAFFRIGLRDRLKG